MENWNRNPLQLKTVTLGEYKQRQGKDTVWMGHYCDMKTFLATEKTISQLEMQNTWYAQKINNAFLILSVGQVTFVTELMT